MVKRSVDVEPIVEWLEALDDRSYVQVVAAIELLEEHGPHLGRPVVDTVVASRHRNMKELRLDGTVRASGAVRLRSAA